MSHRKAMRRALAISALSGMAAAGCYQRDKGESAAYPNNQQRAAAHPDSLYPDTGRFRYPPTDLPGERGMGGAWNPDSALRDTAGYPLAPTGPIYEDSGIGGAGGLPWTDTLFGDTLYPPDTTGSEGGIPGGSSGPDIW